MDLNSELIGQLKGAIKKVKEQITQVSWHEMPVILIDFLAPEVKYFDEDCDAEEYIKENHTDWDEEPPEGENVDLVLIKYCTQHHKDKWCSLYRDYKFFKEVNGQKVYRKTSLVEFEPELVINVII